MIRYRRFLAAVFTRHFRAFAYQYGARIASGLALGIKRGAKEVAQVQIIESIVNSVHNLNTVISSHKFSVETKSVFIHGGKSMVQYHNPSGGVTNCELGDLIFISTLIENGQVVFQRMTINQFKWQGPAKRLSWKLDMKQLHLLAHFPPFWGRPGATNLVPPRTFTMANFSGCLGSYGLLHRPGDFVFVDAPGLSRLLGSGHTISHQTLAGAYGPSPTASSVLFRFLRGFRLRGYVFRLGSMVIPNFLYAQDVYDFAQKYLLLGIGEPTFEPNGRFDAQARNLLDGIRASLRRIAASSVAPSSTLVQLIQSLDLDYSGVGGVGEGEGPPPDDRPFGEEEPGGVGIVHTVFRLGEGFDVVQP